MGMTEYELKTFWIRYGLGGGFGGCRMNDWEEIKAENEDAAEEEAFQGACEVYDTYEGTNGLRTVDEIMEEEGLTESDAEEAWYEEREGWLDYEVTAISPNVNE